MSSSNRSMFWRIIRRLLAANRGRLVVILLALGAGAAITAALLNLQVDAKRRITTEFRTFGPNVLVTPRGGADSASAGLTLPESVYRAVPAISANQGGKSAVLYVLAKVASFGSNRTVPVIVVGSVQEGATFDHSAVVEESAFGLSNVGPKCRIGSKVADLLKLHAKDQIILTAGRAEKCSVLYVFTNGTDEDTQIFLDLQTAQRLADLPGRISLVQLRLPGTTHQIDAAMADLRQRLPDSDVRPIRQFTEGEAKIYDRISGILSATVALVLLLTALCVMAAMTNVAMERRNDVGLMKAIGGATRRVLRLFLAEAALLGLTGGVLGAAVGILLSMWLGKAVFGVAARPRLIVYPVAVALTIIVAIAGAYPLRRLANIRPAAVFRGEA